MVKNGEISKKDSPLCLLDPIPHVYSQLVGRTGPNGSNSKAHIQTDTYDAVSGEFVPADVRAHEDEGAFRITCG